MPKILHCADLHLDSPFRCGSAEKSEVRRRELRGTFSSLILYIRTEKVELALLSGDLFDSRCATREGAAFLARELASAPDCRFVIAPGNHDPFTEDSLYARTAFSDNVFIFREPRLSCFSFPELNADVYGWAFTSPSMAMPPLTGRPPLVPGRLNLLCAHADLTDPLSPYCPMTERDVAASGFDYCAFGHIHARSEIKKAGETYYSYSGCLEGRDFGETGHKGAYLLNADKADGRLTLRASFKKLSARRYEVCRVDVSGAPDGEAIRAAVRSALVKNAYGSDTLLRLTLCGSVPASLRPDIASLTAQFAGRLFYLEIRDETLPLYDTAMLEADPTVRGAFFKELRPILENGTPEERLRAAHALRLGLAALSGEDAGLI